MTKRSYSPDIQAELMKIFGTPSPSERAVRKWRLTWAESDNKVRVSSFVDANRRATAQGIDKIFWQVKIDEIGNSWMVLFNPEHEVLIKMHT